MKKTLISIFSSLAAFILASCDSDSFNKPLPQFFAENTDSATIVKYEFLGSGAVLDSQGYWNIPSSSDFSVKFTLKNSQGYTFQTGKNMKVTPEDADIYQDSSKMSIFLTYSKDFLLENEKGGNITPVIELFHPISNASFEPYSSLKMRSNTVPPKPLNPAVYHDNDQYIVAFNIPPSENLTGIHGDLASVEISMYNKSKRLLKSGRCEISVDENGILSVNETSSFKAGDETAYYIPATTTDFVVKGQPMMWFSDVDLIEDDTYFELSILDEVGLKSTVEFECGPVEKNVISSVYVSSAGSDANDGTIEKPFKTIDAAIKAFTLVSNLRNTVIFLTDITENINITESARVVTFMASNGDEKTLTGAIDFAGDKLTLSNIKVSGDIEHSGNSLSLLSADVSGDITLKKANQKLTVSSLTNTTPITLKLDSSVASSYGLGYEIIVPQTGATLTESDVSKIKLDSTDYSIRLDATKNAGVISDIKATAGDNPEGDPTEALTDFGFELIDDTFETADKTTLKTSIDNIIINLSSADSKFNSATVESLEVEIYSGSVKLSGVTTYPDPTKKSVRVEVAEIYVGNYTVVVKAKINGIFYTSQKIIKVDFGT